MAGIPQRTRQGSTRIGTNLQLAAPAGSLDRAKFTIGDLVLPISRRELYAVAARERPVRLSRHGHTLESTWATRAYSRARRPCVRLPLV